MESNISFEQLEKIILEKIELANLNRQSSNIIISAGENQLTAHINHSNNDGEPEFYFINSSEEKIINEIEKISSFMLDRNDMIPMKSHSFGEGTSYIQMIKNLVISYKGYLPKVDTINKKTK